LTTTPATPGVSRSGKAKGCLGAQTEPAALLLMLAAMALHAWWRRRST
jgi:hypothetical protein